MKFCPYCGAELMSAEVSFCSECGKSLEKSADTPKVTKAKKKTLFKKTKEKKSKSKNPKKEPIEEAIIPPDQEPETPADDYDGYYDDVLPFMEDAERQALDKELIKKISLLIAGMLAVIILCVILLYQL